MAKKKLFEKSLIKKCYSAVDKEIKKEARIEAKKILELSPETEQHEFVDYHEKDQGNVCCLVLDKLKNELVKAGKMSQGKTDHFGGKLFFE